VGFGTSAPELVTSVQAAVAGSPQIAYGNIVGSNISNILLILGLSALIAPLAVQSKALRRDGAFVVVTAALLAVVGYTHTMDRVVGLAFIVLLAAYIVYAYFEERVVPVDSHEHTSAFEKAEAYDELHDGPIRHQTEAKSLAQRLGPVVPLFMALGGLAIIVAGGKLLVDGAIGLSRGIGISETVIGLTIVAVGTSMPEFVTCVVAALRKHGDVALGNVLGSNVYNVLGIGGTTAMIKPTSVPAEIVASMLRSWSPRRWLCSCWRGAAIGSPGWRERRCSHAMLHTYTCSCRNRSAAPGNNSGRRAYKVERNGLHRSCIASG
jgi:cation:H+ antiporter